MFLSYNVIEKDKNDSCDSIKEDAINEIENIMNNSKIINK
jgi:hypothetical protein